MLGLAQVEHAAIAELQDQDLAVGLVVEPGGERADAGVLIAEREARLALVGRDQVEALEVGDVAPAAGDLAVGHLEDAARNRLDQRRDGAAVEDAVTEVAEDDGVGRGATALASMSWSTMASEIDRLSSVSTFSSR